MSILALNLRISRIYHEYKKHQTDHCCFCHFAGGRSCARSAVGFTAVANARDFDGAFVLVIEEYPIVVQRRRKPVSGGLSFSRRRSGWPRSDPHSKNLHCGFALDGPQVGSRFGRPDDAIRSGAASSLISSGNSRRISSWGIPSPRASAARARSRPAAVSGVISSSSTEAKDS